MFWDFTEVNFSVPQIHLSLNQITKINKKYSKYFSLTSVGICLCIFIYHDFICLDIYVSVSEISPLIPIKWR